MNRRTLRRAAALALGLALAGTAHAAITRYRTIDIQAAGTWMYLMRIDSP